MFWKRFSPNKILILSPPGGNRIFRNQQFACPPKLPKRHSECNKSLQHITTTSHSNGSPKSRATFKPKSSATTNGQLLSRSHSSTVPKQPTVTTFECWHNWHDHKYRNWGPSLDKPASDSSRPNATSHKDTFGFRKHTRTTTSKIQLNFTEREVSCLKYSVSIFRGNKSWIPFNFRSKFELLYSKKEYLTLQKL